MSVQTPEQLLTDAHKQWLDNPVTQQLLSVLTNRIVQYANDLQQSAMVTTDEKFQQACRTNIKSVNAVITIIRDTPTFVRLSTTK